MTMTQETDFVADRGITTQRTIRASRERVYEAFLDSAALARWFGPHGFQTVTHEMDARPGGLWRFTMHGPDGTEYPNWARYLELVPPERISWDHGDLVGGKPWFRTTVTFDEVEAGTHVILQSVFPTQKARDRSVEEVGAIEGGRQTLARLAAYVEAGGT